MHLALDLATPRWTPRYSYIPCSNDTHILLTSEALEKFRHDSKVVHEQSGTTYNYSPGATVVIKDCDTALLGGTSTT